MKTFLKTALCITLLATHAHQFAAEQNKDVRIEAGGFSFSWPRKIDVDVTPATLVSFLGLGVGLYGIKLYSQGSEKVASADNQDCARYKEGNTLQWEGIKLIAAGLALILQKKF